MDHPGYGDFRARREASVWQRLNSILRVLLVLALVLVIVSLFLPQSKKLRLSRAEIDEWQVDLMSGLDALVPGKAHRRFGPAEGARLIGDPMPEHGFRMGDGVARS